jgi:hypothetical protein
VAIGRFALEVEVRKRRELGSASGKSVTARDIAATIT